MKKFVLLALVLLMLAGVSTTALATGNPMRRAERQRCGLSGAHAMRGADGSFLDREAFEANLNALLENGIISEGLRDLLLERNDSRAEFGGRRFEGRRFGRDAEFGGRRFDGRRFERDFEANINDLLENEIISEELRDSLLERYRARTESGGRHLENGAPVRGAGFGRQAAR